MTHVQSWTCYIPSSLVLMTKLQNLSRLLYKWLNRSELGISTLFRVKEKLFSALPMTALACWLHRDNPAYAPAMTPAWRSYHIACINTMHGLLTSCIFSCLSEPILKGTNILSCMKSHLSLIFSSDNRGIISESLNFWTYVKFLVLQPNLVCWTMNTW